MSEHHLADLPNSEALPTADMSSAELKNLGYPLGSVGLSDMIDIVLIVVCFDFCLFFVEKVTYII